MMFAMAGWTIGQVFCSWYQVFGGGVALPSPSWADAGFLSMPMFALAALVMLATNRRHSGREAVTCARLVLLLDALLVAGSLFVITWSTALGAVVRAGAPTPPAFAIAIAYPITDLALVAVVVALVAATPGALRDQSQLVLLGLGLVALAVSDSVFAYLVGTGATHVPPLATAGFMAGPALIAVAGFGAANGRPAHLATQAEHDITWWHLLLPYVPVVVTGGLILSQVAAGKRLGMVEASVACLVVCFVVARQITTLVDNSILLKRVSQGRQRLLYQASHDPLPGLANRALFSERLTMAIQRHRDEGRPFALMFADLDDFKVINDNLGHAAGDRLLRAVAKRLTACVPDADHVARLGGDEFAVLVEVDNMAPETKCEQIMDALRRPFHLGGASLTVSASVGVVTPMPAEPALTAGTLLRRADTAMYTGKRNGKGMLIHLPNTATEAVIGGHLGDLGDRSARGYMS